MRMQDSSKRTFRLLWSGETLNLYVEQFIAFAAPLLIVTRLGGSVSQGQVVTFLFFLPYLALGLNAGVWLERQGKQRVVLSTALAQAGVLLVAVAAAMFDRLGEVTLGTIVLLSGVIAVFFQIAYQSYLPTIYSSQVDLLAGNSKLALSDAVTRVAGPATAGWLLLHAGVIGSFALQFALMTTAAILFGLMRRDSASSGAHLRTSTVELIREGMRFVRHHQWLNPIISCGAYYTVFVTATKTTVILYLVVSGKASEPVAGVVSAGIAFGYGTGSVAARRSVARFGTRRTLQFSAVVAVSGAAISTWAAATLMPTAAVVVTALSFVVHGFGDGLFAPTALSVRQVATPPELISRVTSVHRFFIWGGMSLGALLAAVATAWTGPQRTLMLIGVLVLGALPVLYRGNLRLSREKGADRERDPAVALLHVE
jgi:MFS family permease